MVIIAPSSPASTDPDTESGGKMQLIVKSRPNDQIKRKAMRVLSLPHLVRAFFVVWTVKRKSKRALAESAQVADAILQLKKKRRLEKALATSKRILAKLRLAADARKKNTCTLVGHIDPVGVVHKLQKNCGIEIFSGDLATARSDPFPATMRITELQPIEDTDLERKRSLGTLRSEEQLEQSEKQQEDQPPPGQADSYISQVEASSLSHPLPPLSLPLASKARPSSSPISRPTFPFAPSSSCMFWNESLVDMPAHSSISGGVCLPKDMKLMKKGLEAHDQLYDSAVHHLLSGIDGIGELKRHYDLHAGEQASRLKEADDTAIMLREQVEELEAKLSMANMPERRLMDMVRVSEDGHARTKRELALVREKMDKANCRIDYLEAAVSRYQDRIVAAEIEKEKTEERASRASVKGETMSTPGTQPSGSKEYLPEFCSFTSPGPYLTDLEMCKESVLFPGCDLLYGQPLNNKRI